MSTAVLWHSVFWLGKICFVLIFVALGRRDSEEPPGTISCVRLEQADATQAFVPHSRNPETLIKPKAAMA